jgi:hypothetical protein
LYITKIIIGSNIELIIRRILYIYLLNTDIDKNKISELIEYILTNQNINEENDIDQIPSIIGHNDNILNYLYNTVCPQLVAKCSEIYKNKLDE